MKNIILALVVATSIALFVSGCGNSENTEDATDAETEPKQESAMETLVGTVTGAKQIEAGKKAEDRIRAIQDEHDKKLDDLLNQ